MRLFFEYKKNYLILNHPHISAESKPDLYGTRRAKHVL